MARMLKWLGLATLSLALTSSVGCVSQEKYNAKVLENSALSEQLNSAQQEAATNSAQSRAYQSQLATLQDRLTTDEAIRTNLETQNKDLTGQVAELDAKYKDSLNSPPKIEQIMQAAANGQALPAPLSNALADFAASHPDVIEFDPIRGIVKFKSDVTFATGSDDLPPEAKSVIDKFSAILDSPAAAEYELQVAGHTDNVPVTNPQTLLHHKNNWYLSAHRAISVGTEMMSQGVSKARIAVVGYGDQRPIADNSTSAGRKENRRVEVLILPTRRAGQAVTAAAVQPAKKTPHRAELNKDSAASDNGAEVPEESK
jgi:chemotaxis protein MotB